MVILTPGFKRTLSRHWHAVLLGLSLSGVSGCASSPPAARLLLEVAITPKANRNAPVPITLVAIHEAKLFERVVQMSAKEWYDQREQIRRDFPSGTAFTEWDWEFVPGQSPPPMVVEVDGRALGAVLFANYRSPGSHRFRLGPQRRIRIDLADDDLAVSPLDEGNSE
jgi:type VI secretion system protein